MSTIRRCLVLLTNVMLVLSICACGRSDDCFFSLNGQELDSKDVAAFVYVYVTEFNIRDVEQLEEFYEGSTTYQEYYKQELENDIIETVLLYKEAKDKGITLTAGDREKLATNTSNVLKRFEGEDMQEDVSKADIEKVYEMKLLGEAYLDAVSQETEEVSGKEDEASDSADEAEGKNVGRQDRYVKVYQVIFPIVELDEEGMVRSDEEGNLVTVSTAEVSKRKEEAVRFAEQAGTGADMEMLLEDVSDGVTGVEKYLKYDDLATDYKHAVDAISVGEVSGVIESDYGFYVVKLLEKDSADFSNTITTYEEEVLESTARTEELNRLYSLYAGANKEYKNNTLWDTLEIRRYIK
ncbi:MAG: peptidyl-prolyl cis-trans isomerase [Lachnospiraceae bacterium]|nr:peptidyl-prolyl cis-trans isomerase [Lachnospiraceae bacterium]